MVASKWTLLFTAIVWTVAALIQCRNWLGLILTQRPSPCDTVICTLCPLLFLVFAAAFWRRYWIAKQKHSI